jgi:serine/threonine protein kinase
LPIIEADEYDGQIVIVSEFAPDGSLEDLLNKKGGLLSVKQSVEMTIGILTGLEFLHSRNIIHRDLKPANVLLQGETPRLADFGISRVMKTNSASQNAAGTPFYMSPEAFDRKRNAQTDIWAIGVMLYQMLAGKLPFPSDNVSELVAAIVMREPEPLPHQIPISLRQIIAKALAKQSSERYQTASQIKQDLCNFLYKSSSQTDSVITQTIELSTINAPTVSFNDGEKKSIAILPFKNLSGDAASQFYEFSLADAVTTELARLRSLIVRPSSVIARYQNKVIDAREAGKEMKVDSILSAAFIHSGTHLRVTAQL